MVEINSKQKSYGCEQINVFNNVMRNISGHFPLTEQDFSSLFLQYGITQ
jgi:hypothetical protein